MTDYVRVEDFSVKDGLLAGDPEKAITGADVDSEFDAIVTAIASKEDEANKGQANGYCGLDAGGLVDETDLPTGRTYLTLNLTTTDEVDLTDTDNSLNLGALGGTHLGISPSRIQAKASATTANGLDINRLGGNVNIGAQSGTGHANFYRDGTLRMNISTTGIDVSGSNVDIDNSSSAVAAQVTVRNNEGGIRLRTNGGQALLQQVDTDGESNAKDWIVTTRDGGMSFSFNDSTKLQIVTTGADVTGILEASSDVTVGGTSVVLETRTISTGSGLSGGGALSANRTLNIDFSGLSAMTASPAGGDEFLYNDNGTIKKMSYNNAAFPSYSDSNNRTFSSNDAGEVGFYTGAGSHTWTIDSDVCQNAGALIIVNTTANTLLLDDGGTVTLNSAYSLRTLAAYGTAIIRRYSSTVYNASGDLQ